MACYYPWTLRDSGEVRPVACGQCLGCRLEKSRQWAIRCVHEAQLYRDNCSITLTYDDAHAQPSLNYRDFQLFMKRLRKHARKSSIRFYMAGEYGETTRRAHFHALLFNYDFNDKIYHSKTPQGHTLFTSPTLSNLWPSGYSTIGNVTYQSASYISRYILKKITGSKSDSHYLHTDPSTGELTRLLPEFNNMSRRPGLGRDWLKKFTHDVYPEGNVTHQGSKSRTPRYYDNIYKKTNPFSYKQLLAARREQAIEALDDSNNSRLEAKHTVKRAQLRQLKRTI